MIPTKPFRPAPSAEKRARFLPRGSTVHGVAELCREAGVAFAVGASRGWGRRELGEWLLGMYAPATCALREAGAPSSAHDDPTVDAAAVERVVLDARARVFAMLEDSARDWARASFARDMVDGGFVVGVRDVYGALGYAPVGRRDMRLFDRVASLFVADYLTRPADCRELAACDECGAVSFDGPIDHAHWCESPPTESGIVMALREVRTLAGI